MNARKCRGIAGARQALFGIAAAVGAALCWPACSNPVAPLPPDEGIFIYQHSGYGGDWDQINDDDNNLEYRDGPCGGGPDRDPHWGDCISSVRVNPGWTATLYQHDSFKGQSLSITADVPDLAAVPGPCNRTFNECVSSIRVSKTQ